MTTLKKIIENSDSKAGKLFDIFIQILIIISLICFSIETLPNISLLNRKFLNIIEISSIIIFTIEYILRIIVADNKIKFIFSFYGLVDLCAILPFYITRTIDLRSIRILRLFRILRIFKITRYNAALKRLGRTFIKIKET